MDRLSFEEWKAAARRLNKLMSCIKIAKRMHVVRSESKIRRGGCAFRFNFSVVEKNDRTSKKIWDISPTAALNALRYATILFFILSAEITITNSGVVRRNQRWPRFITVFKFLREKFSNSTFNSDIRKEFSDRWYCWDIVAHHRVIFSVQRHYQVWL